MRLVADTNTVISGLLWHGPPSELIQAVRSKRVQLFSCAQSLEELRDVLRRPKLAQQLRRNKLTPQTLVLQFTAIAEFVEVGAVEAVVQDDPDDDIVLACASTANAEAIVSGDHHLLDLREYRGIPILTAREFLDELARRERHEP